MSKPTAIFARTPMKNVNSSPASNRTNSAKTRNQTTPSSVVGSSPRKCRLQTEIQSSPSGMRSGINVKSKINFIPMSSKVQEPRMMKPSPIREQNLREEDRKDIRGQPSMSSKTFKVTGIVQFRNARDNTTPAKHGFQEPDSTSSGTPRLVNVKSMRSCFERKENKLPSKPPPSPSPSRPKPRLVESQPMTPKNTNPGIKGILSSKSKYENSPSFRAPSTSNPTPPRANKLRRSFSAGTICRTNNSPQQSNLVRCSSQTITPKHRVKFQDELTPECFSPVLLESKGEESSAESIVGEVTNLTVAVRVRPPFPGERNVVSIEGNSIKVKALGSEHCFSYDYCFNSSGDNAATQEDVFNTMVEPLVNVAFQGYNVCLFAYGQTGSGKSYSMMGEEITSNHIIPDKAGIIPRFSQQLFAIIESSEEYSNTKVEISYFEIYNEKIHDLLGPSQNGRSAPLRVREHPELGPYVVDLTVHTVYSFETLQDWLRVGNSHKATAATEMNMNSSRSHSIFTITLTQSQADDRPSLCSKINLVDLAGSERLAHTCATGDRLKEGVSINRSLLTLGKVISSLAENKKRGWFIPYRESVLTWLLRESLGGNSRTAMLATISPSSQFVDETLSTLRYACQARNIINTVRINESPNEKRIRELLEEIQRLKDGIESKDHAECIQKNKTLQAQLEQTIEDLNKAKIVCTESEMEIDALTNELTTLKESQAHEECKQQICKLQQELIETNNQNLNKEKEIKELKKNLSAEKTKNFDYEKYMKDFQLLYEKERKTKQEYEVETCRLRSTIDSLQKSNNDLGFEIKTLKRDFEQCRNEKDKYESDISEMKNSMLEIKKNMSHGDCETQILMLETALQESERFAKQYKEKIKSLEKNCSEITITANHDGCEKEISALKETICELKKCSSHEKCDKVIEKLKTALSEAEKLVSELGAEISSLKETKAVLETDKESKIKELLSLKETIREIENKSSHIECEERIATLKKAVSVAKSMNTHIQCENRIAELEMEVRNLQSVTLTDHSMCEEKISNLFFAIEKYADENNKLVKSHKAEILKYEDTIKTLEECISKLTKNDNESKQTHKENNDHLSNLEIQSRSLKEENSKIKKKRVEDEKKILSLEQQVISLTKELLDVKNQLRVSLREKESSDSMCSQLQEQLIQQDRKLALSESSRQLYKDEKENWETPSKVIRRSIARYSSSKRDNDRCSLVVKAEEIHQALKDAEDICSRLKIPWLFQLEPEVTTHSWFDVNVRVWDQRKMSSVRWPREVFLGWLKEMKEEIMSKTRGQKLFRSASWLQNSKDPEPLPIDDSENTKKMRTLQEEVDILQSKILALEKVCELKDKQEVMLAVNALRRAVNLLSSRLGLSSPLQTRNTNSNC